MRRCEGGRERVRDPDRGRIPVGARPGDPGGAVRRRDRFPAGDRGFVTAESAVVFPVLVMFAMALVWGLLAVATQIRCADAARTGARAAARQDPAGAVVELARGAAPRDAEVTVSREGDQVRVAVVARPPGLRGLPFEVREEAVASVEGSTVSVGEAGAGAPGEETGVRAGTDVPMEGAVESVEGAGVSVGETGVSVDAGEEGRR